MNSITNVYIYALAVCLISMYIAGIYGVNMPKGSVTNVLDTDMVINQYLNNSTDSNTLYYSSLKLARYINKIYKNNDWQITYEQAKRHIEYGYLTNFTKDDQYTFKKLNFLQSIAYNYCNMPLNSFIVEKMCTIFEIHDSNLCLNSQIFPIQIIATYPMIRLEVCTQIKLGNIELVLQWFHCPSHTSGTFDINWRINDLYKAMHRYKSSQLVSENYRHNDPDMDIFFERFEDYYRFDQIMNATMHDTPYTSAWKQVLFGLKYYHYSSSIGSYNDTSAVSTVEECLQLTSTHNQNMCVKNTIVWFQSHPNLFITTDDIRYITENYFCDKMTTETQSVFLTYFLDDIMNDASMMDAFNRCKQNHSDFQQFIMYFLRFYYSRSLDSTLLKQIIKYFGDYVDICTNKYPNLNGYYISLLKDSYERNRIYFALYLIKQFPNSLNPACMRDIQYMLAKLASINAI